MFALCLEVSSDGCGSCPRFRHGVNSWAANHSFDYSRAGDPNELPGKVVVGLVAVKPEKGPLFPDYDCRAVARGLRVACLP